MQRNFFAAGNSLRTFSKSTMAIIALMVVTLPTGSLAQNAEHAGPRILTQDQADNHKARVAGGFIGVGVSLEKAQIVGVSARITAVEADSTAQEAGLKVGDNIIAVAEALQVGSRKNYNVFASAAGTRIIYWSASEVQHALQVPPLSSVTLTIVRADAQRYITVKRDIDGSLGISMELFDPYEVFRVTNVFPGSPAEVAGIAKDDYISEIDGSHTWWNEHDNAIYEIGHGPIGSQVSLTIIREHQEIKLKTTRGIVPDWGTSYGWESRSSGDRSNLDYNRTIVTIKNLDWKGLPQRLDADIDDMNKLPGAILDLRGASGDDPEIAAQVLTRFVSGSSDMLRVRVRQDGQDYLDLYSATVDDTTVIRRRFAFDASTKTAIGPALNDSVKIIAPIGNRYTGKLVVLVDDQTAGTAEAVAHALQYFGNRAQVVGFKTAGQHELSTFFSFHGGKTMLTAPAGTLLSFDANPMTGVVPDHGVWFRNNLSKAAEDELAGRSWYNDPNTIIAVGTFILSFLLILLTRARRARRAAPADEVACTDHPGSLDSECEFDYGEFAGEAEDQQQARTVEPAAAPVETKDSKPDSSQRGTWHLVAALVLVLVAFCCLPLGFDWFQGPGRGAYARVTVTSYVDGSELSVAQQQVATQLAWEYSGAIEFQTIDIRRHPQVQTGGEAVTAPSTRIGMQWYRKDGTELRYFYNGIEGPAPKREIVSTIAYMAHSEQRFWPSAVIHRRRQQIAGN